MPNPSFQKEAHPTPIVSSRRRTAAALDGQAGPMSLEELSGEGRGRRAGPDRKAWLESPLRKTRPDGLVRHGGKERAHAPLAGGESVQSAQERADRTSVRLVPGLVPIGGHPGLSAVGGARRGVLAARTMRVLTGGGRVHRAVEGVHADAGEQDRQHRQPKVRSQSRHASWHGSGVPRQPVGSPLPTRLCYRPPSMRQDPTSTPGPPAESQPGVRCLGRFPKKVRKGLDRSRF